MKTVSATAFRRTLGRTLSEVATAGVPTVAARRKGEAVVILRHAEYRSMAETLHLMGNPHNARRLLRSVQDADQGRTEARNPVDLEPS